ncbi:MAG TPA: substrate-binding domain-containing protein [Pseudonocardiaceae bacterium]|nr:substrate-binding domain-containing protein [Pseudonocardiaceae bacterium]
MKKLAVVLVAGAALLAGCGGGSTTGSASTSTPAKPSGKVQVLYAASLENLMEKDLGPDYTKASGVQFEGTPAGSTELVSDIKGKVKPADVFISASTDANSGLMGSANGGWESWYATFATAPLVIGYNPKSKFANDLKTKPWQQVITEPGFLFGSTDPKLDPKGKLGAQALQMESLPATTAQVFPEEQLVARLSTGQLDAGFFYSSEAADAKIPTITLGSVQLKATYTVSVLNKAPNSAAGTSFVSYLLGSDGLALLRKHGLQLQTVKVTGTGTPSSLQGVLGTK